MRLQFDPNQRFQLDAMAAVTDLFDGQDTGSPEYAVITLGTAPGLFAGQVQTELGVGNALVPTRTSPRRYRQSTRRSAVSPSARYRSTH